MSTKAQLVLEQIKALPIGDQQELLRDLVQHVGPSDAGELYGEPLTDDDIEQSVRVNFQMLELAADPKH